MKDKHLQIRKDQCDLISSASTCPRRKVGCVIIDPDSNSVISEGYNGPPRGASGGLCGGEVCLREASTIVSGTQNDIGCHHAEMNAIFNATRTGVSTLNKWLFTSCDPCLMCAKAIHHAGVVKVYTPLNSPHHRDGLEYLEEHGVILAPIS
jgi:dCMP deaminase